MQRELLSSSLASWVLLVVVQSLRLVAPLALCVGVQRKEAGWHSGSHSRSCWGWHARRIDAREHGHAGNEALGPVAGGLRGTAVVAREGYARPVQNVGHMLMTKQVVESDCPVFEK